jgi:hypothetical protein
MFMRDSKTDTQLAVLQEKLNAYETMMNKLDEAIQIIGTTSQNISKMLAVHEEKLDTASKNDGTILNMINDMKRNEMEQGKELHTKIDNLATKVEQITNFRWLLIGGMTLVTVIISAPSIFSDLLTPDPEGARIELPAAAAAESPNSPSVRRQAA